MLDLDEVIDRLKTLDTFLDVSGAVNSGEILGVARLKPSAWVIPSADKSGNNEQLEGVLQTVQTAFEVVYNIASAGDAHGHAAHTLLRVARVDTWAELLGWMPTGMAYPVTHDAGKLIYLGGGLMQWVDRFETAFLADYPAQ